MVNSEQPAEVVFTSRIEQDCVDHALVLRAVGIRCIVQPSVEGYALIVGLQDATRARAELDAYARENRDDAARAVIVAARTDGWAGALCYAMAILLVAMCADWQVFGLDWFGAGRARAGLICDGQIWRAVTALTLHADGPHLLANLVIGGLFGLFTARLLGSGLAWFSILIGGAAGNAIVAWLLPAEHTSVGASTAVFAALGLLSGWASTQRRSSRALSLTRWIPLIGGVVLLSYLGGGGERTDVGAHIAGFGCGLLIGAIHGKLRVHSRLTNRGQALLATGALLLLMCAWVLALVTSGGAGAAE